MRLRYFVVFPALLFILSMLPWEQGCGGVGGGERDDPIGLPEIPVAPPAPPLELPSPLVLRFVDPADLRPDFSTLELADPSPALSKAVDPNGEFAVEISLPTNFLWFGQSCDPFDVLMWELLQLEIPVSTNSSLHAIMNFGIAPREITACASTKFEGLHDVKVDFSPYDFNNDLIPESCSGHTAALPICVRVWIDDQRYAAWYFETYPYWDPNRGVASDNPGKGRMKISWAEPELPSWLGLAYDEQQPAFSHSDFYIALGVPYYGFHIELVEEGSPATALKQFGLSANNFYDEYNEASYLAQYREGYDFWSGSIDVNATSQDDFGLVELENQCAVISTAMGTDPKNCLDVGGIDISVGGLPFPDLMTMDDVVLNDFPYAPPAGRFQPISVP